MTQLVRAEPEDPIRILDIGSGYGPVATACLDAFPNGTAIGLDISEAMMEAGRERMARFGDRFSYLVGDFADGLLPQNVVDAGPYDLIVSARAIHHLSPELMKKIYADINKNLKPKGAFFNLDTASTEGDYLRDVLRRVRRRGGEPPRPQRTEGAAREHAALTHHREATLARHMEWLKAGGFVGAECFWKRLEMALIGGYKE